ncbi:MAG: outer membrane beta-barrel protein [Ignavibacteriales bacterium]|nr:MAG: hypothetical protein F9K26_00465 [Ignavibacteriaceae bacterium]MBW7871883.1 hypothetical protein [Ignavibacteria bacterium]MCZ2144267.1 outer membrane beta-barrel protein [Ignavibacteriales bacterium]OQY69631.1 MAG: hypothetical protein B6D45_12555 [Ignavibacteriales bacterium UTCHB3]MBV6446220.1 hypothetical protein [Ignavibacteriaceae bacterium]
MNRIIKVVLFVFLTSITSQAQLFDIEGTGSFSTAGSLKYSATSAKGFGMGVRINFETFDDVFLSLSLGYQSYFIEQDSALQQWNWNFWDNRYWGSVRADLTDTAKYKLTVTPNQGIHSIPISISVGYETNLGGFRVKPYLGIGMLFYTRWFYVVENWEKKLTKLDSEFKYNYRNFAPPKLGNPIMYTGGLSVKYPIFDDVDLSGDFSFTQFLETDHMGYTDLPFRNELNIKFGVSFRY